MHTAPALPSSLLVTIGLLAAAAALLMACGCAARPRSPADADYVFVYLKTGPATKSAEESRTIFQGHMANMNRLADAGSLLIAGPFNKPIDPTWRGIFLMDVPTVEQAAALVATDPGVASGVFITELRPFLAPPSLRQASELERALLAARAQTPANSQPPPNIRSYVMVTAADAPRTAAAIRASPLADKIIWSGRFADPRGGGVFVLDATSADVVRPLLPESATGECRIDGWLSTASLEGLPRRHPS